MFGKLLNLPPSSKFEYLYVISVLTQLLPIFPFQFSRVLRNSESLGISQMHTILVHDFFVTPSTPQK